MGLFGCRPQKERQNCSLDLWMWGSAGASVWRRNIIHRVVLSGEGHTLRSRTCQLISNTHTAASDHIPSFWALSLMEKLSRMIPRRKSFSFSLLPIYILHFFLCFFLFFFFSLSGEISECSDILLTSIRICFCFSCKVTHVLMSDCWAASARLTDAWSFSWRNWEKYSCQLLCHKNWFSLLANLQMRNRATSVVVYLLVKVQHLCFKKL